MFEPFKRGGAALCLWVAAAPLVACFADAQTPVPVAAATGYITIFGRPNHSRVRLVRDGKVTVINVKEIRKNPALDIKLLPGDILEFPESFW